MGACSSCIRMILDAESDVKIHVIEPTSVNGPEHSVVQREPAPPAATLQVPTMQRIRTAERERAERENNDL